MVLNQVIVNFVYCFSLFWFLKIEHIVGWESKPRNSDFYQNDFLSTREYQTHGAHSVEFSLL